MQFSLTHRTLNSSIHYTRSARSHQFIFLRTQKKMKKQQKMLWYSEKTDDKREWQGEENRASEFMRNEKECMCGCIGAQFLFLDRKAFNMKCAFSLSVKVLHSRRSQVLRVPLYGNFFPFKYFYFHLRLFNFFIVKIKNFIYRTQSCHNHQEGFSVRWHFHQIIKILWFGERLSHHIQKN